MGAGRVQAQRWIFSSFFGGPGFVYADPDCTEDEVRAFLDQRHYGGNWKPESLRRGKKYKVARSQIFVHHNPGPCPHKTVMGVPSEDDPNVMATICLDCHGVIGVLRPGCEEWKLEGDPDDD